MARFPKIIAPVIIASLVGCSGAAVTKPDELVRFIGEVVAYLKDSQKLEPESGRKKVVKNGETSWVLYYDLSAKKDFVNNNDARISKITSDYKGLVGKQGDQRLLDDAAFCFILFLQDNSVTDNGWHRELRNSLDEFLDKNETLDLEGHTLNMVSDLKYYNALTETQRWAEYINVDEMKKDGLDFTIGRLLLLLIQSHLSTNDIDGARLALEKHSRKIDSLTEVSFHKLIDNFAEHISR